MQRTNSDQLILVDLVEVEEIRPRTDPSSVSDLGTGLGVILVLKRLDSAQLCVETPFRPALFSVFSSIN